MTEDQKENRPPVVDVPELSARLGGDFTIDPHPAYAALRAEGPIHRVRIPFAQDTTWLVVGHEEARAALTDPRLRNDIRHSADWQSDGGHSIGRNMLQVDPPDHTRLRSLVAREFTARRIERLRPRVQQITDELLDAATKSAGPPHEVVDLVPALAFPLPITVICELLGVPVADRDDFRAWSQDIVAPSSPEAGVAASQAMAGYFSTLIAAKRRSADDGLLSALIRNHDSGDGDGDHSGDRLSDEELLGMAFVLLVAGHETTVGLISGGLLALLRHPEQWAALCADWSLLPGAVEEMLRYDGPVPTSAFRFATEPVEVAGTVIPSGDPVLVGLAAAGRDPERFDAPDRFDIHRRTGSGTGGHLAFGHGIHHCLGAPLARLEGAVAVRTLLERFPDMELAAAAPDEPGPVYRVGALRNLARLPVHLGRIQ